jgi:hypothetical protein
MGGTSKQAKNMRSRFCKFWTLFTEKAVTLVSSNVSDDKNGTDETDDGLAIVRTVVEQLVSLSSMGLVHIRNVVTEAALMIGCQLVMSGRQLEDQLDVSRRLEQAEAKKGPNGGKRPSAKYTALKQQVKEQEATLNDIEALYMDIYAAVFVHRCCDASEEIRAISLRQIGNWLTAHPAKLWRADYFAYIGNALSDKKESVRKEALGVISMILERNGEESKQYAEEGALQGFVDDYSERLVELVCDSDDGVLMRAVTVLRQIQSEGLLDQLDEERLDVIDEVTFDPNAPARARFEALGFMLDHTEGFQKDDDDEEADAEETQGKKSKKKGSVANKTAARALERRQRTAQQLETLTEFVEYHLERQTLNSTVKRSKAPRPSEALAVLEKPEDKYAFAALLGEAVCSLEHTRARILRDWSTIISLLLRDSESGLTTTLEGPQASILLRLFVHSAQELQTDVEALRSQGGPGQFLSRVKREQLDHAQDDWDSLRSHLQKNLSDLLVRFRDEESNLEQLSKLLAMCEPDAHAAEAMVNVSVAIFNNARQEWLLESVASSLNSWLSPDCPVRGKAKLAIEELVKDAWSTLSESTEAIRVAIDDAAANTNDGAGAGASKKKKARKAGAPFDAIESTRRFALAGARLLALCKNSDCADIIPVSLMDTADVLVEAIDAASALAEAFGEQGPYVSEDTKVDLNCYHIASRAAATLKIFLYWQYRSSFVINWLM